MSQSKRFPFGIPSGWFTVAYSADLAVDEVKSLHYFGKDLVLFRDENGAPVVLDAFCPHLGAHLGEGGKVENGKITCPFHAWQFDGTGTCVKIPYANKIPKKATLATWQVREMNQHIFVWHDAAGREPLWEPPEWPEASSDDFTDIRTATWTINTCNQEMAENQVDAAHFFYVHGSPKMPVTTVVSREGHHLTTKSTTAMNTPAGVVDGHIEVNAWGFGLSTTRFMGLVETFLMASATPIDADRTEMMFAFSVRKIGKGITGGVGKAFMAEIKRQLEQDIPIWENKIYVDRPLICDGDGPIGVFRQWSKQFYPSPEQLEAAQQGA